jgi:hypothetical protein
MPSRPEGERRVESDKQTGKGERETDFLADNERIRAMQPEQIAVEGGKPKQALSMWSAQVITIIGMLLPVRLRVAFTFAINFAFNNLYAVFRLALAYLGRGFLHLLIFLAYYLVVGPSSLLSRLLGEDPLSVRPKDGSYFTTKEPPDTTEERFERQF